MQFVFQYFWPYAIKAFSFLPIWPSGLPAPRQTRSILMKKQVFGTSHVPLSPAVRAGDFVYVSGQVPVDAQGNIIAGDIKAQTRQVLDNVKTALALAGATMDEVVKTTAWLQDARDFGGFNQVYGTYFPKEPPARSTAESRLMIDIKVEVEAIAYSPRK